MEKGKGFSTILTIVLTVVIAGVLGAGIYFGYNWWNARTEKEAETVPTPTPDLRAGWRIYTDSANGFSLKYPPDWTTKDGTFPSTHGETLKDTAFLGETEKVFVTVRTNPDETLESFVSKDGVTNVQTAKVEQLSGFAATTADTYRVYLGKDDKVYMFTFPGAKTDWDLSANQVNLLTSFQFAVSPVPSPTPSPAAPTTP